jgi:hypothetical protein
MDLGVGRRGVQGVMAQNIGDELKVGSSAVRLGSPTAAQQARTRCFHATLGKSASDQAMDGIRT